MRLILGLFSIAAILFGQSQEVVLFQGPPNNPIQTVNTFSGTNLTSTCYARSTVTSGQRRGLIVSISAASNASPVSLTSTAHGFNTNSRPSVTISGGTGSWTAINGTFTATVTGVNTFTIPVDSTAFGALAGTITFTTTAPRTGVAEWAVKIFTYDGSSNLIWAGWLYGSSTFQAKCSDASSTTIQVQ